MSYPTAVLDVVRAVLLEHMSSPEYLPCCRVQRALYVGQSGRVIAETDICDDDTPNALLLTMADGSEVLLTVTEGVR